MLFEDLIGDPTAALIHLERRVNKGSPSGFLPLTSHAYSPMASAPSFRLPIFAVPSSQITTVGDLSALPAPLVSKSSSWVAYPVHPEARPLVEPNLPKGTHYLQDIDVTPTASVRTVFYEHPTQPIYIKLHYPAILGRFARDIPRRKWISSFENSNELLKSCKTGLSPSSFAFLHEFSGVLVNPPSGAAPFGVIYRETAPRPISGNEPAILIPFFSLFSPDSKHPEHPVLLDQLLRPFSDRLQAAIQILIRPVLDSYRFQAIDLGLIPENNAQNILLQYLLGSDRTRIVHRDMMGTFIDLTRRRELRLHTNFNEYHSIDLSTNPSEYFKRRSFEYDFKLGLYVFYEIERVLSASFGVKSRDFRAAVRQYFRRLVHPDPADYFGEGDAWYAYPRIVPRKERPYQRLSNPQYR